MTDRPDRYVDINVTSGSVRCDGEEVTCPGVLLTCYEYAEQVDRAWLPYGDEAALSDGARVLERVARALSWAEAAPQY